VVTEVVDLPANTGKRTVTYSFHLLVTGAGGTRSARAIKATVGVGAGGIPDSLAAGSTLQPGAFLLSPSHQYELAMQTDGNLVLYHEGAALWSSQTSGKGNYLAMQPEGNLVVYNGGKVAQWNTGTWGFPGAYLQLQDDGNLVLYQDGHAIWTYGSGYKGDIINEGEDLQPGAYLLSPDHNYQLIMQADGNLVLYHGGSAVWATYTSGSGNYAVMQTDGNFVVYNGGTALWDSMTSGFTGAYLQLQDDSNLVIYQGGTAIWDWASGRLGGTGPTPSETAAVNWASGRIGSTAWYGLCLSFTFDAYQDGAGINLEDRTAGVTYNAHTDPRGRVGPHRYRDDRDRHASIWRTRVLQCQGRLQPGRIQSCDDHGYKR